MSVLRSPTDQTLLGSWQAVGHPAVAELVAGLGYDFIGIDMEHSPATTETLANLLRAVEAAAGETKTLVRVANDDPTMLQQTLDLAPDAVLVPMVHTADQAEAIVDAVRHPPAGCRGVGTGRASTYGRSLGAQVEADDTAFGTHVQLESERAVENAADIAAVDGIDGVFVGPIDLSAALDCFGEFESERFTEAVERAVSAAREEGVAVGTFAASENDRERRLGWDIDYIVAGMDLAHIGDGAVAALEHAEQLR
ncbi:2-dehydro-3-deoxyglucarate aldolase/4-hydroxy-2-oxoheptanedioate aldolase [Halovenus aranensis]|uniref:2-dehydro-3-deoxyglucarate aldolase/4-hydroxy-2-oxoheptanedioate aldolase n=1 Tax=Halovenus aranensis TaxID=890420 RepID=A0A1G8UYL3_9EURY|nr:aldolase/citrate lyase family protein [Halovenus aranensis]SDJ58891.1 2-dehydro-3-deoxyglucarate aldolase/4-hydroxy-2-oxoheptanedioate aldolase [Halovenus aranensis]